MNYIIFEDKETCNFAPFSDTHATFEIRCGLFTNLERIQNEIDKDDAVILIVRDYLTHVVRERYPNLIVNPHEVPSGQWLNGLALWDKALIESVNQNKHFVNDERLIAFQTSETISLTEVNSIFWDASLVATKVNIKPFEFLWDAIYQNGKQISTDADSVYWGRLGIMHPSVILVNEDDIHIAENCGIGAGVVLDASNGAIIIEEGVFIDIGAMIKGPVYIGKKSVINLGAKIRENVTIGEMCKIGGEVEDSIFHGFSNKQHDGFIGHSYIGEWVNLGANTNNSDLKNNYSNIKFYINDKLINTKLNFLGSMIGDFVKTGISTMLNTGTYIGIGANVFGAGFQPKKVLDFSWGIDDVTQLEKFMDSVNIVKSRRGKTLTNSEEQLLIFLYHESIVNRQNQKI
jgi:UDP-N-acetylglucosamine diphosphorylase / glucose-1-phosphate thymidylyltransferase / UDP-N-acetylgalactosamine diphosphorylase / glucosamine-1-phosphate N-acetyltransferase / galactosamine-1-phosphate N-acetyltransferase